MLDIERKIYMEYRVLYDHGYVNEKIENNGFLFSSLNCINHKTNLIFNFSIEKGITSIAITTKELLLREKKSVFFDFFYILKILYPEKSFEEIKLLSYQEVISMKLSSIENLFSRKQIYDTMKKINTVTKEYSKIRWKLK